MGEPAPKSRARQLLRSYSRVVVGHLIPIERNAVWPNDENDLGDEIDNAPELRLRALETLNVSIRPVPSDDLALLIADRHGAKQEPAVLPVRPAGARFFITPLSGSED